MCQLSRTLLCSDLSGSGERLGLASGFLFWLESPYPPIKPTALPPPAAQVAGLFLLVTQDLGGPEHSEFAYFGIQLPLTRQRTCPNLPRSSSPPQDRVGYGLQGSALFCYYPQTSSNAFRPMVLTRNEGLRWRHRRKWLDLVLFNLFLNGTPLGMRKCRVSIRGIPRYGRPRPRRF